MGKETIYDIAFEMLQSTNIFDTDVAEIKYSSNRLKKVSLVGLIECKTQRYNHQLSRRTDTDLHRAFSVIAAAMLEYLEEYPATFSFKQQTKMNFKLWLEKILDQYDIQDTQIPDEFKKNETDTGIALLKLLHAREGRTYEDLRLELGIGDRAIQKDLNKLSPSLYAGPQKPDVPFRLGGQPLLANIELVSPTDVAKEKHFYTPDTVHPLVLQENIMQLATLLKALAHQYYGHENDIDSQQDDIARLIAIDIWSQMSEYAQQKMKDYFAFDDETLSNFIDEVTYQLPDDRVLYRTEKEQLKEIELSTEQCLQHLMKAPNRTGTLELQTGQRIRIERLYPAYIAGKQAYEAVDTGGNTTVFTKDQIKSIQVNK